MQKTPELAHLLEGRGNLYRFLSRFYLTEVDEAFWTALRGMTFPDTADEPRMAEGWQRLAKVVASDLGPDPIETLAVDYARIFLSAGVSEGAAYPIESVYTSPEHLVMQDAWDLKRIRRWTYTKTSSDLNSPSLRTSTTGFSPRLRPKGWIPNATPRSSRPFARRSSSCSSIPFAGSRTSAAT